MSYAGVEYDREPATPSHCGNAEPHTGHRDWHYGGRYTVCTGQLPPVKEKFEFKPEECPHDYSTSKCTGCGYESG